MEYIEGLNKRELYANNIRGLQFVALEILKQFDSICKKNNIEYWITDGTLLGAIRSKKFIPWDDDIDICIKKEDLKKLVAILKKELPDFLYLTSDRDRNNKLNYYKIRDRYSMALEYEDEDRQTGIWIDIFPMTDIKENTIINYIIKRIPDKENIKDSKIKKSIRNLIYKFLYIFGYKTKKNIVRKYFSRLTEVKDNEKNAVIYMEGQEWWHTYRKEWIFPLKEIEFEGCRFLAPNNPEKYLKSYYGKNYMQLPPENKRIAHSIKIDLFNSNNHPESLKWSERKNYIEKYGRD